MDVLWAPTNDEIIEILSSQTAIKDFDSDKATISKRCLKGETVRIALLWAGDKEIDGGQLFVAGNDKDLHELINYHPVWRDTHGALN